MADKLGNLCRFVTATTGTGPITVGAAVSGSLTPIQSIPSLVTGDTVIYSIADGANSECGRMTYDSTGPTFTRAPFISTAGVGVAISLSGSAQVVLTATAEVLPVIAVGKTLTVSNTLTLTATDGSTLAIGGGGTLGTGAYATIANYLPLAGGTLTAALTVSSGTGSISINPGDASHAGSIFFIKGDGSTRLGYFGFSNTNVELTLENAASFVVSAGNVLIGTATDAGQKLQVNGTSLLGGNTTVTGNLLFTDAIYDIGASGATRPRDYFGSGRIFLGATYGGFTNVRLSLRQNANADDVVSFVRATNTAPTGNFLRAVNADGSANLFIVDVNGNLTAGDVSGQNIVSVTAGKGLQLKSGTGARAGNATLVGGTVTVTNTTVTANTIIVLTRKTSGGTLGMALTYTLSTSTSFTINSDNALDTSTISYMLFELN